MDSGCSLYIPNTAKHRILKTNLTSTDTTGSFPSQQRLFLKFVLHFNLFPTWQLMCEQRLDYKKKKEQDEKVESKLTVFTLLLVLKQQYNQKILFPFCLCLLTPSVT